MLIILNKWKKKKKKKNDTQWCDATERGIWLAVEIFALYILNTHFNRHWEKKAHVFAPLARQRLHHYLFSINIYNVAYIWKKYKCAKTKMRRHFLCRRCFYVLLEWKFQLAQWQIPLKTSRYLFLFHWRQPDIIFYWMNRKYLRSYFEPIDGNKLLIYRYLLFRSLSSHYHFLYEQENNEIQFIYIKSFIVWRQRNQEYKSHHIWFKA